MIKLNLQAAECLGKALELDPGLDCAKSNQVKLEELRRRPPSTHTHTAAADASERGLGVGCSSAAASDASMSCSVDVGAGSVAIGGRLGEGAAAAAVVGSVLESNGKDHDVVMIEAGAAVEAVSNAAAAATAAAREQSFPVLEYRNES